MTPTVRSQPSCGVALAAALRRCRSGRSVARQDQAAEETFHFTPKSGSWLNAVEGFFSKLTRQRIRRGVFRSIVDLQAAINRYLAEHNDDPKPFAWTKPADAILAKLNRLPVPSV
jgi:hypothetical protein